MPRVAAGSRCVCGSCWPSVTTESVTQECQNCTIQLDLGKLEWQVTCVTTSRPHSRRKIEGTHKFALESKIEGTDNAILIWRT